MIDFSDLIVTTEDKPKRTSSNVARTQKRVDARATNCIVCNREMETTDLRWKRCEECRVIPVIQRMIVAGENTLMTTFPERTTGRFTTSRIDNHISLTFILDGHEETITLSESVSQAIPRKGKKIDSSWSWLEGSAGFYTISCQPNGDIRVSLAINGQVSLVTFDIWKLILPAGNKWPANAVIKDVEFSVGTVSAGGLSDGTREGAFIGVDSEGLPRECWECPCGNYTQNPELAESKDPDIRKDICVCGHPEVGPPTSLGKGHAHKLVLLGCGEKQYQNINGLSWEEVFEFLYDECFREKDIYVGFFLKYDFTLWLRGIPASKAYQLFTDNGIEKRRRTNRQTGHSFIYPVLVPGNNTWPDTAPDHLKDKPRVWEMHMHAGKRLDIRLKVCDCCQVIDQHDPSWCKYTKNGDGYCDNPACEPDNPACEPETQRGVKRKAIPGDPSIRKCRRGVKCKTTPFMHINDSGSLFQKSFLRVISPDGWDIPICEPWEYKLIEQGKERRASAGLDDEMRMYNLLELELLARVMERMRDGMHSMGLELRKDQWYSPGQSASVWMDKIGAPKLGDTYRIQKYKTGPKAGKAYRKKIKDGLSRIIPEDFYKSVFEGFIAGWFEIMVHGIVSGTSYNYDINSAYPHWMAGLPCLDHADITKRESRGNKWRDYSRFPAPKPKTYRYFYARIWGKEDSPIGPMMFRDEDVCISRPISTEGWYWEHEIAASAAAGLIDRIQIREYWEMKIPCDCPPPFAEIKELYYGRLAAGKDSPEGIFRKLTMNSGYGKTAQTIGDPPYRNIIYASLITSGCRTQILEAIASHPRKANAVLMIATDGVNFDSPHPGLDAQIAEGVTEWNARYPGHNLKMCSICMTEMGHTLTDCQVCKGPACVKTKCRKLTKDNKDPRLGSWSREEKTDLTLFKPGVYWDEESLEKIDAGETPELKSRGVPIRDFSKEIHKLDEKFKNWNGVMPAEQRQWPSCRFRLSFSMSSCKQALQFTDGMRRATEKMIREHEEEVKKLDEERRHRIVKITPDEERELWRYIMAHGSFPPADPTKQAEASAKEKVAREERQTRWEEDAREAEETERQGKYKYWWQAGKVSEVYVKHSSWPGLKRGNIPGGTDEITGNRQTGGFDGRVYRSKPLQYHSLGEDPPVSTFYDKTKTEMAKYRAGEIDTEEYGLTPDGYALGVHYQAIGTQELSCQT